MPLYGYGKILDVNLSSGTVTKTDISPEFAAAYVGGMGFSLKILYDAVGPETNPLGPENIVVFAVGPLTGTQSPCSGRVEVSNKSPLTGHLGSGNSGGVWPAYLKFAGYDVLVVRGMSDIPVYLWIDGDNVEIRKAAHLWGTDAPTASDKISQAISPDDPSKVSVLAIGQAGENLVRFACTLNDYHHVAARGGAGAVLGSKKLKAVAINRGGRNSLRIADPDGLQAAITQSREQLRLVQGVSSEQGESKKPGFVLDDARKTYMARGCLPAKNFQTGVLPDWFEKMGRSKAMPYITGMESTCYACTIPCFDLAEIKDGKYAGTRVTRGSAPGVMFDFGAKCAVDDIPAVLKCKELCQTYAMDYASTAGVIAFAQELYQRGLLTKADTDGLDLTWGNDDSVVALIHKIALREGLGDILAEGSVLAAQKIGKGSEKYVMCIKGMEAMIGDPRSCKKGFTFGDITNPRGGDNIKSTHFRADAPDKNWLPDKFDIFAEELEKMYGVAPLAEIGETWEGKPAMTKWFEDLYSACNALCVCFFPAGFKLALGPTHYARMYSACVGREVTAREMMQAGERIFNLMKAFIAREGLTRKDDHWGERFYTEPLPEGPSQGAVVSRTEIEAALDVYYRERGWNVELGLPTAQKLSELGLNDVAKDLAAHGKLGEVAA